jgi:lysophospholipase L1-like esterase
MGASRGRLTPPLAALVLAVGLLTTTGAQSRLPSSQHWVATWGTAQLAYRAPAPPPSATPPPAPTTPPTPPPTPAPGTPQRRFGIPRAVPGLSNQTIRMIVRTSIGGSQVRIRMSQAFGAPAVTIGSAHIATRADGASIVPGSDRPLTFSGKPGGTLYAGQVLISDPVALEVRPLSDLAVSLFFPGETGPPTGHTFGLRPTYVSTSGDQAGAATMTDLATTAESYFWLSGIDVVGPASSATLVTFGDSITDGDQSTPDTLGMWPAVLAGRLQGNRGTSGIGVVNAAISGNRVLGDNNSGLARLARDVLAVPGVRWMTLMEGINDITGATRSGQAGKTFTAETLIAAYRQVIETAHAHGVSVIGCTLTPYGGSNVFTDEGEAIRQAVNAWIRTGGGFDGVIDFDAATRDPQAPARFRTEVDSPDLLHPANPGYALMARAVDLSLFTRRR